MRQRRLKILILTLFLLMALSIFVNGCVSTTDIIIIEDVHVEIDYEPVLSKKL